MPKEAFRPIESQSCKLVNQEGATDTLRASREAVLVLSRRMHDSPQHNSMFQPIAKHCWPDFVLAFQSDGLVVR